MGRRQVLFVVDAGSLVGLEQHVQQARAICLACCRILVHLAGVPSAKNIERIKWSYQILPAGARAGVRDIAVHSNTRTKFHDLRFQDLRSESLEVLYKHVMAESSSCEVSMTSPPSLIYSGLASAVQDYLWEAPDLTTPTPLCLRKRGKRNTSSLPASHSNMIFIFSSLPRNQHELDMFCGQQGSQLELAKVKIKEKILSGPLISQLISKDIALHWIESGNNTGKRQESIAAGLGETVHTLIGRTGGSLISMDSLVTFSHMVPVTALLHSSITGDEVEQAYSTGRHLLCGPDGESLCPLILTHSTPLSKVEQFFGTRKQELNSDLHRTSDSQSRFEVGGIVSRCCLWSVVQSGSYPVSILDLEQSYHCIAGSGDKAMGVSLGMAAVDTKKSSNVFQMICLWLTKNKLDLVITIQQDQSSYHALLRPISSLMATFTILKEPFSLSQSTDGNSKMADAIWASLLSSAPFSVHNPLTSDVLLPWYPLGSTCGVPSSTVEHLKEAQSNHRIDGGVVESTRGQLLSQLQSLYSSSQGKIGTLYEEDPIAHAADEVSGKPPPAVSQSSSASYIEALDNLTIGYSQLLLEEPTEMIRVLDWVRYSFQYLEASLQDSSQESSVVTSVWQGLQELLLSDSELRDKYAGIEGQDADEKEKIRIRMAYDYKIQVLLHLAAARFGGEDTTVLANQIVGLLRRISLLTHPGVMGRLLKDIILPEFAGSCQSLLVLVYDGLMLPLPPALSPPSSPITPHSNTSSESVSEEDDWSNHRSLGSKPSTLDTNSSQPSRVLTRCNSFHGLQTQRQIVVKRSKKDSSNSNSLHSSGKGARRSLFSRSFSVAGSSSSSELRKRKGDSWQWHGHSAKKSKGKHKDDVIVTATPKKKQVENYWQFKLQRRRSKSSIVSSPGVKVIEESPQRSFYSSAVCPSVDGFRTPPSASKSRQQVFVKKDPSPAGLHSLLHGEIVSPHVTPEGRRGFLSSCSTPSLATLSEGEGSPELISSGGSVSGSECGDHVCQRRGIAVARSLSYGKEDEEEEEIFLRTPVKVVSDPLLTPQKSILKTPERLSQTPKKSVTFLHGVDPLENDSASMVAFALCTPTKEDSLSFSGVL